MDSAGVPSGLFWRTVLAFLALPVVVAFIVPWLLGSRQSGLRLDGLITVVAGTVLLVWCVRDFYVAGRGTLAPWAPPRHLVTIGLYRISRNPMYIAVLIILCGWALAYRSRAVWVYAGIVAIAVHLRVVFYEEHWLSQTHGNAWTAYRDRVPRWVGPRRL